MTIIIRIIAALASVFTPPAGSSRGIRRAQRRQRADLRAVLPKR